MAAEQKADDVLKGLFQTTTMVCIWLRGTGF